jgi:uncharacterized surface protein with fasciclin (FAS1) repeats
VITRRLAFSLAGAALFAACQQSPPSIRTISEDGSFPLLDLLRDKPEYSRFLAALEASGLTARLGGASGAVTLFVPVNDAFAGLPPDLLAALDRPGTQLDAAQRARITALVQANAAWGLLRLQDIQPRNGRVVTWDRARLQVAQLGPRNANLVREGAPVVAGRAPVAITRADVLARDGVLHITNGLVLPAV